MAISPDKWTAVKELFEAALEKESAARAQFLDERCRDAVVRAEVERLLTEHEQAGSFLSTPALDDLTSKQGQKSQVQRLSQGEMLSGRFRIVRFIASGGMGEVYEAEDEELHERVAIKTLRSEILQEPTAIGLFRSEVHLARRVTHPNVCRVYDLFRDPRDGHQPEIAFVSMEFLPGETLASRLHRQGRMAMPEALPLITQMTAGLSAAHDAGIIHGDFKPGNVVLVEKPSGPRAVITDFGLAFRAMTSTDSTTSRTTWQPYSLRSGTLRGTPAYMAPEQLQGLPASTSSDIYSLGLVIFEMVTGTRPFQSDGSLSVVAKRLTEPPPPPRKLEPSLTFVCESVILKCLDRHPAKRFIKAQDVAKALSEDARMSIRAAGEPHRKVGVALAGEVLEGDACISYAYMDDLELIEGRKGWVANLHRALQIRLGQLLGKQPEIWRDPKIQGDDVFDDMWIERLRHVVALVSVVSPPYVKSEWARKELAEFWKAAEEQGGVRFRDKPRIFKVLKTPVPLEMHPPQLKSLLGYAFFNVDPDTGRVRELDEVFGPEAQRDFWIRLDDLAHDICCLLEMVEAPTVTLSAAHKSVFLAQTTLDLREQREAIRRDLQQHGYTVLPEVDLPQEESELNEIVRANLVQCQMSIHLIGKNFGPVPEGCVQSLIEIQNELAIERGRKGNFSRLVWIPPGLQVEDERQRRVIQRFRMDPRIQQGADLLETFLEDLKSVIHERLITVEKGTPVEQRTDMPIFAGSPHARIYLIYDQRDAHMTPPWEDFLFGQKLEVIRPVFEGDEAEIWEYHQENLRSCDGALILFGSGNECWLRRKLRELQKSRGYGRTKPMPAVAISLVPPKTPDKERFRTHEALVISQWDGFSPEPLQPLISRLKG
jgi:protein kinase-like protein/uncharacterized protein DUF4062